MKLARIAAAVTIALPMAGAFAANSSADTGTDQAQVAANSSADQGTDQTQATADQHKWYQASERALQAEREREALDAAGFPQYGS